MAKESPTANASTDPPRPAVELEATPKPLPAGTPAEEKKLSAFLDEFASSDAQRKQMREMIEGGTDAQSFLDKYLKPERHDSHYGRHFLASIQKVVR